MRKCTRCEEEKEVSEFYPHKRSKDGLSWYCKSCDKIAKAEYYQRTRQRALERAALWAAENPEKVREAKRKWKRANPDSLREHKHRRRAKESVEHFTAQEWKALLDRWGHKCLACGSTERLSADHVVPLSKGGSNGIDNIQPLCVDCNCKKGSKVKDYREI